jgi:predicted amidohydrolase YtcJ
MFTIWNSLKRVDGATGESRLTPVKQITREEAIMMYTLNGARLMLLEDKLGTLEAGKLADLVVVDTDILECPVDDILSAKVLLTMVGGKVVHSELSPNNAVVN